MTDCRLSQSPPRNLSQIMDKLQEIFADLLNNQSSEQKKLPPVESWHPSLSGDMDLTILRNGTWMHEGAGFARHAIVQLLSKVIKREESSYYLVTPVEKWRIQVEDVPFYVDGLDVFDRGGEVALCFTTATGDCVVAGASNPLRIETDSMTGEPSPYILIRGNLEGRLSRSVFYKLVELALQKDANSDDELVVESLGVTFSLGTTIQ
jgi:hypothetical protein